MLPLYILQRCGKAIILFSGIVILLFLPPAQSGKHGPSPLQLSSPHNHNTVNEVRLGERLPACLPAPRSPSGPHGHHVGRDLNLPDACLYHTDSPRHPEIPSSLAGEQN